jgi:hypothetical protein
MHALGRPHNTPFLMFWKVIFLPKRTLWGNVLIMNTTRIITASAAALAITIAASPLASASTISKNDIETFGAELTRTSVVTETLPQPDLDTCTPASQGVLEPVIVKSIEFVPAGTEVLAPVGDGEFKKVLTTSDSYTADATFRITGGSGIVEPTVGSPRLGVADRVVLDPNGSVEFTRRIATDFSGEVFHHLGAVIVPDCGQVNVPDAALKAWELPRIPVGDLDERMFRAYEGWYLENANGVQSYLE